MKQDPEIIVAALGHQRLCEEMLQEITLENLQFPKVRIAVVETFVFLSFHRVDKVALWFQNKELREDFVTWAKKDLSTLSAANHMIEDFIPKQYSAELVDRLAPVIWAHLKKIDYTDTNQATFSVVIRARALLNDPRYSEELITFFKNRPDYKSFAWLGELALSPERRSEIIEYHMKRGELTKEAALSMIPEEMVLSPKWKNTLLQSLESPEAYFTYKQDSAIFKDPEVQKKVKEVLKKTPK